METGNRLVPHPHVLIRNWEGYLHCRGPSPTPGPPAQRPEPGRGVPTPSGCEHQSELPPVRHGCWKPRCPLKGLPQTHSHTRPGLRRRDSRPEGDGTHWEELSCVASGQELGAATTAPVLQSPPYMAQSPGRSQLRVCTGPADTAPRAVTPGPRHISSRAAEPPPVLFLAGSRLGRAGLA